MQVRTRATAWFGVIVFAYYYKVLFGVAERGFGLPVDRWILGIDVNHWIETIVYCPLLWFALHQVNTDVFGDPPEGAAAFRRHRRLNTTSEFAIALVLYGTGLHIANVVELYSQRKDATSGDVYDLVYFLDEGVSHYVQFVPLFFVLGWFVVNDRIDRTGHASLAVFFGVGHGIERAVGIIEGGKWFLAPLAIVWLLVAVVLRVHRRGSLALDEFFVRYALAFCVSLPLGVAMYRARYGSFAQPSRLETAEVAQMAFGAVAATLFGTVSMLALDRALQRRRLPAQGA
jgi:hypothetical protein